VAALSKTDQPAKVRAWRAPWFRQSFSVKINFILGLGLAILIAVAVLAQRSVDEVVETGRTESEILEDVGKLQVFLGNLRRAEAAQREYLITGNANDIPAYRSARARVDEGLKDLQSLVVDPDQRGRLRELADVVDERLARLDHVMEVRRTKGAAAAAAMVGNPRTLELNLKIEAIDRQFGEHAFRSLHLRRADTATNADFGSYLIFWGAAFAACLLLWAMVIIQRHQSARRAAERAVRASEKQLRLITDAVPALIGYVDGGGRLQFHNLAFEQLFNRSAAELRGRALRELLGEGQYAAIEPHIAEVLQGNATDFKFPLVKTGGEKVELSAQLVPRRNEKGEITGYYALITDITALTEVERLKSEFIATVSHELRTPLTSIWGSLGLLAGGAAGNLHETARELVTIATQSCERLVRLVNDVLDSEKMESGKMQFAYEVLELGGVIERSLRETEGFASAQGVRLQFDARAREIKVRADRDRLVQVVTNLLSNASKFSPPGGAVEVAMEQRGAVARVSVSDRGPGVPAESRAHLFDRFYQVDSTNTRSRGGTGLGLSICKGIVERLGGAMAFASREGGGSIFYFELPVWFEGQVA